MEQHEYLRQLEEKLDRMEARLHAAEKALTQIPQINFELDPSKLPGVVVAPAALVGK